MQIPLRFRINKSEFNELTSDIYGNQNNKDFQITRNKKTYFQITRNKKTQNIFAQKRLKVKYLEMRQKIV